MPLPVFSRTDFVKRRPQSYLVAYVARKQSNSNPPNRQRSKIGCIHNCAWRNNLGCGFRRTACVRGSRQKQHVPGCRIRGSVQKRENCDYPTHCWLLPSIFSRKGEEQLVFADFGTSSTDERPLRQYICARTYSKKR